MQCTGADHCYRCSVVTTVQSPTNTDEQMNRNHALDGGHDPPGQGHSAVQKNEDGK